MVQEFAEDIKTASYHLNGMFHIKAISLKLDFYTIDEFDTKDVFHTIPYENFSSVRYYLNTEEKKNEFYKYYKHLEPSRVEAEIKEYLDK